MLRRAVCFLILLVAALRAEAQQPAAKNDGTRQPRILLLVDASSSMLQPWSAKATRFQTAASIITTLMDSIYAVNGGVEFGLRVYGHQSPAQANDCFDTRQEVMFSKNNVTQMGLRLASIRPFGVSPIAYSLQEAANNDLVDEARNAYSIILITDGGESCGGNICDIVKQLLERKIYFKPYIISLVDYAPLKGQYACLGSYLQAAKPEEVPTAIKTIVDAYRPILSAPIMAVKADTPKKQIQTQAINIPSWIPERSNVQDLTIKVPKTEMAVGAYRPILHPMALPHTAPVSKPVEEPVVVVPPRRPETVPPFLKPAAGQFLPIVMRYGFTMARRNAAVAVALPYIKPEPESVATLSPNVRWTPVNVSPIRPRMARRGIDVPLAIPFIAAEPQNFASLNPSARSAVFPVPGAAPATLTRRNARIPVALPNIPPDQRDTIFAINPSGPTVPPRPKPQATTIAITKIGRPATASAKPATQPSNKPKETIFTKETEDAKETSLAILFTDGRGKFYSTTPQLQLLDAKTGKLVKQFYRTVDESGNPDPQVIPAGTYNLLVVGRTNMLMRNVTVEANKKNKVTVKVGNGSLRFEYYDAPGRPVSEYEALVNIRFEPGPTIRQRCTAELEYPPGNYYIEVNTMPITRFNVDIDFGATSVVYVPEPGFVQFTNTTPKGRISLFAPLGDKFVRFTDVNVTGNPASQKLMLKPGLYEIHRVKNPNMPYASETVENFHVQSNAITEIELN